MFLMKLKLSMLIFLIFGNLIVNKKVSGASLRASYYLKNYTADSRDENEEQRLKEHSKYRGNKPKSVMPYMNFISGKSKEWTNYKRSQPLKRSDNPIISTNSNSSYDSVLLGLNSSYSSVLEGLNSSNSTIPKYSPINLLYGNNLTVKNYFLMMPRCNGSDSGLQPNEECLESCMMRFSSTTEPPTYSPNEVASEGSAVITQLTSTELPKISVEKVEIVDKQSSSTTPVVPPSIVATNVEDKAKTSTSTPSSPPNDVFQLLNIYDESSSKEILANTKGVKEIEIPMSNSSITETVDNKTTEEINENVANVTEKMNVTVRTSNTSASLNESSVEKSVLKTENTTAEVKNGSSGNTTVSKVLDDTSSLSSLSTTVVTLTPALIGNTLSTTTSSKTTIDKNNDFFRTIDKYCETFNMSDLNSTYTIHPVDVEHYNELQNSKDDLNEGKKSEFSYLNKNPKKNFKRLAKKETHKETTESLLKT